MVGFVGRSQELQVLNRHLAAVADGGAGTFLSVRGRRQVGKSRLVEEFLHDADTPGAFFTAAKGSSAREELRAFGDEITRSSLEAAPFFADVSFDSWESALRQLGSRITEPSILVLDELPYLLDGDPALEGTLQRVWDRYLSRTPLLLVVIGSDLSVMEALGSYDRPLYQRMREMMVEPFTVRETAAMIGVEGADAFDTYLALGGFPTLAGSWRSSRSLSNFLRTQLIDSTSPLVVSGERILNAEFPPGLQARDVLTVIGSGETTFATIADRSGLNQGSLTRTLQVLIRDKRVVTANRPLSAAPSRSTLYRVADPYLRFWLRFISPNLELLLRGRGDLVVSRVLDQWPAYRGKAVEPVIRASIERMLPDDRFGPARQVGSYWTRTSDLEVDLVGGNASEPPTPVSFVGTIKWRERSPLGKADLADLIAARARVPGAAEALLIGVSRSGFRADDLDVALGPDDLLAAWS